MDEVFQKALNLSYFFLKFRPRTKKEVRDYLVKKSSPKVRSSSGRKTYPFTGEIIERVLKKLEEMYLIDDKQFAQWYVTQRSARRSKSTSLLKRELSQKGVDKEILEEYFAQNEQDENQQAMKALRPRWARLAKLPYEKRFQKAYAHLARRGFSYDVIKKTVAELEGKD